MADHDPIELPLRPDDGVRIGARRHEPAGEPVAVTLIHGATAVPQAYYGAYARWLAAHGHRVLTYDYRGIGSSRPESLRGFDATMTDWALRDARAAFAWQRAEADASGLPTYAIGHSFGGQLIGMLDEYRQVDGVMLVASQMGFWRSWPVAAWPKFALLWYGLVPVATALTGYLPGSLGLRTDLPAGVAREWGRWCRHPDYLAGHVADAAERFTRFDRPTLLWTFDDDDFAPPGTIAALVDRLANAPLAIRAVSRGGHFGFFRAAMADPLWDESLAFFDSLRRGEALDLPLGGPHRDLGVRLHDVMHDLASTPV